MRSKISTSLIYSMESMTYFFDFVKQNITRNKFQKFNQKNQNLIQMNLLFFYSIFSNRSRWCLTIFACII